MGANGSTSVAASTATRYDFISIPTVNLNPKLSNVLWKLKLCWGGGEAKPNAGALIIAIPKYWSMRARAVFLTRLLTPYGKRLHKIPPLPPTTLADDWVAEPDTATLEDLERLPR